MRAMIVDNKLIIIIVPTLGIDFSFPNKFYL